MKHFACTLLLICLLFSLSVTAFAADEVIIVTEEAQTQSVPDVVIDVTGESATVTPSTPAADASITVEQTISPSLNKNSIRILEVTDPYDERMYSKAGTVLVEPDYSYSAGEEGKSLTTLDLILKEYGMWIVPGRSTRDHESAFDRAMYGDRFEDKWETAEYGWVKKSNTDIFFVSFEDGNIEMSLLEWGNTKYKRSDIENAGLAMFRYYLGEDEGYRFWQFIEDIHHKVYVKTEDYGLTDSSEEDKIGTLTFTNGTVIDYNTTNPGGMWTFIFRDKA